MQRPQWLNTLTVKRSPGPSYPVLPTVDESGQTNVPGLYALGELAGTPLVRLGLNAGHDLVQGLVAELRQGTTREDQVDLLVVGSGVVVEQSQGFDFSFRRQFHRHDVAGMTPVFTISD